MNQYTNVVIIDILHNACPFPHFSAVRMQLARHALPLFVV